MTNYSLSKSFVLDSQITEKMAAVMRMFGVSVERLREAKSEHRCDLEISEGDIVYFSGPSGAGKSVLLGELEKIIPANDRINLDQIELSLDKAVIDCIDGDIVAGLGLLSTAGLNDVFCVLKCPAVLSDGQQWRFRLARAMASGKRFVIADEFCSSLDKVTAAVVSFNVRKFADRYKVTFLLAGAREDFLCDLQPDVIVQKEFSPVATVTKRQLDY
jgi:uncharacterized protein